VWLYFKRLKAFQYSYIKIKQKQHTKAHTRRYRAGHKQKRKTANNRRLYVLFNARSFQDNQERK
jgi:hypothetical protein